MKRRPVDEWDRSSIGSSSCMSNFLSALVQTKARIASFGGPEMGGQRGDQPLWGSSM
jgi:hypothetical protein